LRFGVDRACGAPKKAAPRIRLYLDSAQRTDWENWLATGLFYGITTNPTLLASAGLRCDVATLRVVVATALAYGLEEVHVQTWGATAAEMLERGREIAALDERVVVKVPITREGVATVRALHADGIATTFTALFSPHQALTAALAGATYAAPYLGRISDGGRDGHAEVVAMHAILRELQSPTRLLVASIRTVADLGRLAGAGLDTYTIGARVAGELFAEPETIVAAATFEAAAHAIARPREGTQRQA
jgi:transaldolase